MKLAKAKGSPLPNIRRGELKKVLRHRRVPEIRVANDIENILDEKRSWSAAELGERIELTFEERHRLGIRTIQCIDKPVSEVKAFYRERKRDRDRVRKQKLRASSRPIDALSPRAQSLVGLLAYDWVSITDLADRMKKNKAKSRKSFRRKQGQLRPLKNNSLRKAVHRAVHELCVFGICEEKMERGAHHEQIRFIRKRR